MNLWYRSHLGRRQKGQNARVWREEEHQASGTEKALNGAEYFRNSGRTVV